MRKPDARRPTLRRLSPKTPLGAYFAARQRQQDAYATFAHWGRLAVRSG
jgi:hypothetical protein